MSVQGWSLYNNTDSFHQNLLVNVALMLHFSTIIVIWGLVKVTRVSSRTLLRLFVVCSGFGG